MIQQDNIDNITETSKTKQDVIRLTRDIHWEDIVFFFSVSSPEEDVSWKSFM